jgi:hypothetical protein
MINLVKGDKIVLSQEEQMIQAEYKAFVKHLQTNLSMAKDFDDLSEMLAQMVRETKKVKESL